MTDVVTEPGSPVVNGAAPYATRHRVPSDTPGSGGPADIASHFYMPDLVEALIPLGGRVVVVSDLHLAAVPTDASRIVADELAELLGGWEGPGAFVIAGDGFEMLAGPPDVGAILDSHPQFTAALAAFTQQPGHQLIVLSGNHDGQLAWDGVAVATLTDRLGITGIAFACDLAITTAEGLQRVHIIHGNQSDPYNAFEDPRSPVDTPFGHHIVRDVLPQLAARQHPGSLFDGVQWLDGEPAGFVSSRLFYRKVIGKFWLLAIPFIAALLLRFLTFIPGFGTLLKHHSQRWLIAFGLLVVLIIVVAVVAALATMFRVNKALREGSLNERADPVTHNAPPRAEASRLVAEGYAGMISGHTHQPELSVVGNGFYANTGSGTESTVAQPSRWRLPKPYVSARRFSYVEILAGDVLIVRLYLRETPTRDQVLLERLAIAHVRHGQTTTQMVASLPNGPTWTNEGKALSHWSRSRRVRQWAAAILLVAGVLNILFALLFDVSSTLPVNQWFPLGIGRLDGMTGIVGGLALLGLARGVRHGYRSAWVVAILVLVAGIVSRLVEGLGVIGTTLGFLLAIWLVLEYSHFGVYPVGVSRLARWGMSLGLGALATLAILDDLFEPQQGLALDLTGLALLGVIGLALLVTIPGREHRRTGAARSEAFDRALAIIETYGGDTLDYFALRDDKSWFFTGSSLVAYSVINGVMLVSPDPIGPVNERVSVWSDVMNMAQANSWAPAVLAASEAWLPVYRASGLVDHYLGDEAVVDCITFSLQGKSMKSLRGAYNRMKKSGFRVEIHDPSEVGPELKTQLLSLMTETRQGEAERGYSMTLSRIFDPRDRGLLLAVCLDTDGNPLAFNQYVPAPHVNGYSLDLMRRTSREDVPSGLTDFVILETIQWMAEQNLRGLGLNFATMRAIVAGETTGGAWTSLERNVLHRFSDTMQIESLWKFNKKYEPRWNPRYAVTGPFVHIARTSLAMARAEAVTEIPFIGRLLKVREPSVSDKR
ncbi:MAG TPA: phosphatidylglycerol lysyltransferase domain-containing protein [Acidimicrobiales bacterium]|nr:phosphatidylglycerol lysyltransferase domain-containing protein [Acidimicrobiales bacterium]